FNSSIRSTDSADIVSFIFTNSKPALKLISTWEVRSGPGPIRNLISITNNSAQTVTIHNQESMNITVNSSPATGVTYISDDASWPDSIGVYNHSFREPFTRDLKISEVQDWIPFVIIDQNN